MQLMRENSYTGRVVKIGDVGAQFRNPSRFRKLSMSLRSKEKTEKYVFKEFIVSLNR